MSLQNHAFLVLIARGSWLAEMDISCRILHCIDSAFLAEVEQELLYFFQMS